MSLVASEVVVVVEAFWKSLSVLNEAKLMVNCVDTTKIRLEAFHYRKRWTECLSKHRAGASLGSLRRVEAASPEMDVQNGLVRLYFELICSVSRRYFDREAQKGGTKIFPRYFICL